ncbi:MAG: DoxX family protein [Myxococcaceae bacterium]|nr:DoxX family protein [Myxococcaceae bacterium]
MNALLWVFQILLALHTLMGAVWKVTNSEQSVPSLSALPHAAWLALIGVEVLCAVGLVLPALVKPLAKFALVAAAALVVEMLLFSVLHLASGSTQHGEMIYWLVVAGFAGFIAVGRWKSLAAAKAA